MKHLYTLEEIHRYADEIRHTDDDMWTAIKRHDTDAQKQLATQIEVMREVLLHMHENLEKFGAYRPGLLGRCLAAREIRKTAKIWKPADIQAEILANTDFSKLPVQPVRRSADGDKRI